jgi:hypothetical protein
LGEGCGSRLERSRAGFWGCGVVSVGASGAGEEVMVNCIAGSSVEGADSASPASAFPPSLALRALPRTAFGGIVIVFQPRRWDS